MLVWSFSSLVLQGVKLLATPQHTAQEISCRPPSDGDYDMGSGRYERVQR
jgi:hypothetical protein